MKVVCGYKQTGCCAAYVPPIEGSVGLTSLPHCRPGAVVAPCAGRREYEMGVIGKVAGLPAVAGFRMPNMARLREDGLYDVLPELAIDELSMAYSFARDYCRLSVPWALVMRGGVFCLLKKRVVR